MVISIPAYDEIAEMLANLDPTKVIALKPSEKTANRLSELLDKNRQGNLTAVESYELDRLLMLDHLISLAKAHAHLKLTA